MTKPMNTKLFLYTLHLADNALILAQRNAEWTGHGPVLEQDIAITNISLDLLGQARNFYQYAASLYNGFGSEEKEIVDRYIPRLWKEYKRQLQEDDLAFLRDEHQYLNLLITELPKGDWAQSILRQYFFSAFQVDLYQQLEQNELFELSAIAEKAIKETQYHLRWSGEWVIRLGDGTEESRRRMVNALSELWMFTGEMFDPAPYELVDVAALKDGWLGKVEKVLREAGLELPKQSWMQSGGKNGRHTEHFGYLLTEMQYLQKAYPNSVW
ncbi:MAG: 1,2-phenylacetyl-CoA epoxidase subunit PaaC [Flavisolibacter sp.]